MTDHVYTEDGRRLYTLRQLADLLGVPRATLRTHRKRGKLAEPDVWLDGRTPLWIKESIMPEHFTAWLTTDPSCLDQACADVVVLRDELRGEPDDPNAWASTDDEQFRAATTVDARDGDHEDAQREAVELLEAAGWKLDGEWEATDTGYIVTVTRG